MTTAERFHSIVTRRLIAATVMFAGAGLVFGLLYAMNELSERPEKEEKAAAVDFSIEKKEKKKDVVKKKPKEKEKKSVESTRRPPAPEFTSTLSGLSFDLPEFQNADFTSADKLLGSERNEKSLVMTEDAVDSLPTPRSRVSPTYPKTARQRGIEGHVVLKLRVDERGDVAAVRVVDAKPRGVFEDVAVAAVQRWTFEPATYQGSPVAISVSQRIPFRLN